jgi:cytoskeletal protein RodZ
MFSLGEELKREREIRGIRLGQIAEETRVGVRFLEAIESGRIDIIPGRFYQRAYVRAYARYLDLDEERFVTAYEFAAARGREPGPSPAARSVPNLPLGSAVKWAALVIAGVGLSGAAAAVWRRAPAQDVPNTTPSQLEAFQSAGPISQVSRTTSRVADSARLPFVKNELEPEQAAEDDLPTTRKLRLTLKVDEPCWLEVHTDGESVDEGIKLAGFRKEFEAAEVCLSVGNAGGVSYWINGQVGKPLGNPGQVRKNICITSENAADFTS